MAGYKDLPGLVERLKQTFHGRAAEEAAKQMPAATVREAIPEQVAPAAQSLRADGQPLRASPAPDLDDDFLREGGYCVQPQCLQNRSIRPRYQVQERGFGLWLCRAGIQ